MNEVTRIHLGRQPFTVSVEAHKELKAYLADIEKKVADKDVVQEVELRMSELLAERGITSEKVILPTDVEYLKSQLGSPDDFGDGEELEAPKPDDKAAKRLFRDTDNALVAGVAAGFANYSGLDTTLVRLVFVVLTIFSGGLGLILYLLFWLVVPAANTASERLQMQGRPVTLEALKDSVAKADVPGAARRVNRTVAPVINSVFRLGIKLVGIGFLLAGLGLLVVVGVIKGYMWLHNGRLFQENLFPVGLREEWLLGLLMLLVMIIAIFSLLIGIATLRRKWPIRSWVTALLVGIFILGMATSMALAADVGPRVHARYESSLHTTAVKNIRPFDNIVTSGHIDIAYISSPNYAVNIHYNGNPDLSKVKIHVSNNTLYIDSRSLDGVDHCTMLCLFPRYNMTVQVYAPNIEKFITPPKTDIFYPAPPVLN